MAGPGSIQPVLKNNRNLLRKKNFFKRDKNISERKKELLQNNNGELHFKKVSKEKLNTLKKDIRKKAQKDYQKRGLSLLTLLFTVSILFYYTHNNTLKIEKELEANAKTYALTKEQQLNTKKYNAYMEDATDQFNKKHWKNAIYFYKKALLVKPQDDLASTKLKISKNKFKELSLQ